MNAPYPEYSMPLRSGERFDFELLYRNEPQILLLDDIAHGLAKFPRYVGHGGSVDQHYSVAEHCVLVMRLVTQWAMKSGMSSAMIREVARWAIMHDSTEGFLSDLTRGLKLFFRLHTDVYDVLEANLESQIAERFALKPTSVIRQIVKRADNAIVAPERRALWGNISMIPFGEEGDDVSSVSIFLWSARKAKAEFLSACADLGIA